MATVYIGNAVGDERGKAYGGDAGNQTGKELRIQPWYKNKKGWRVFRPKSPEVAAMLVYDMTAACENPHIGYDQKQRNTLYQAAKSVGFDCAKVSDPCECDCSSLVRVCLAYAGIKTDSFSTANEAAVLLKTGEFEEVTEHTDSPDWLTAGSIIVTCTKGHTAIVLNDGPKANPEPEPEPPVAEQTVMVIAKSVRVRAGDGVFSKSLFIAHNAAWYKAHGLDHGNDTFPLIDIAPSGWYHIETVQGGAYITSKEKYTRLVEE